MRRAGRSARSTWPTCCGPPNEHAARAPPAARPAVVVSGRTAAPDARHAGAEALVCCALSGARPAALRAGLVRRPAAVAHVDRDRVERLVADGRAGSGCLRDPPG